MKDYKAVGIISSTQTLEKYREVILACANASVPVPEKVACYFSDLGIDINSLQFASADFSGYEMDIPSKGNEEYIEVDLSEMPDEVSKIRFVYCG